MGVEIRLLEEYRKKKGWTQYQMAEWIGISERTWRRIRNIPEWKPSPRSTGFILRKHKNIVGGERRAVRAGLKDFIPLTSDFKAFHTRRRGYVTIHFPLKNTKIDGDNYMLRQTESFFISDVVRGAMSKRESVYLRSAKTYRFEYLQIKVDFYSDYLGRTFSLPSTSQWLVDTPRAALESAAEYVYRSLGNLILGKVYQDSAAWPRKCTVWIVTRETRAK